MLSSIRNLPIAAKIYAALAVLAVTACIVAIAAFSGFSAIKAASEEVNASADRVEQAGRGTANLLSYARAVEFLPIEMPTGDREAFEKVMSDEAARFRRRLDQLEAGSRQQSGRDDVAKIRQLLVKHEQNGGRIARLSRDGAFDEAGKLAFTSASIIADIRQTMRGLEERALARQRDAAKAAEAAQSQAIWTMTIVLVMGVVASAALAAVMVIGFINPAPRRHYHRHA